MFLKFWLISLSVGSIKVSGFSLSARCPISFYFFLVRHLFDVSQLWRGVWEGHTRLQILTNQRVES
jgi:hypothetical protein